MRPSLLLHVTLAGVLAAISVVFTSYEPEPGLDPWLPRPLLAMVAGRLHSDPLLSCLVFAFVAVLFYAFVFRSATPAVLQHRGCVLLVPASLLLSGLYLLYYLAYFARFPTGLCYFPPGAALSVTSLFLVWAATTVFSFRATRRAPTEFRRAAFAFVFVCGLLNIAGSALPVYGPHNIPCPEPFPFGSVLRPKW